MAPAIETKKEETKALTKDDLADILKMVLPATIMAMEQAKAQSGHDVTLKALKARQALEEKCHICRQVIGDGKSRGCGGPWKRDEKGDFVTDKDGRRTEDIATNHIEMVVYPNDPIAMNQFDGVQINGAYYKSHGLDHKVWVPKNNNIASMLLKFEEDQRIQQVGRKFNRNSGSIGKNGARAQSPTFT